MLSSSLMSILGQLAVEIPVLVVWIGGLVWALRTWSRHPRVSMLVVVGLAIHIVDTLGGIVIYGSLPFFMEHYGTSMQSIGWVYTALGLARSLGATVSWALILVAMFGWRPVPVAS